MKKAIVISICILTSLAVFLNLNFITDKIVDRLIINEPVISEPISIYKSNNTLSYVTNTESYIPYSYQDLLNIIYTIINNGWDNFSFYCPYEYTNCVLDAIEISKSSTSLTHINNFVHPFNSFNSIKLTVSKSGEINIETSYLYNKKQIEEINLKVDELIESLIKDDMNNFQKTKVIHDYIINNTKYDVVRNDKGESNYLSYIAYGPLFEGYAVCSGYTDLMAVFLHKLGIPNFKVSTSPEELPNLKTGHVWNVVMPDQKWLHLDLTWDDPVSSDGEDYLYHTYFLKTTSQLEELDSKKVKLGDEHKFNKYVYYELKKESD